MAVPAKDNTNDIKPNNIANPYFDLFLVLFAIYFFGIESIFAFIKGLVG